MTNRPHYRPRPRRGLITMSRGDLPGTLNAHLDLMGCTCDEVIVLATNLEDWLSDFQIAHDDDCPVLRKTRADGN